MRAAFTRVAMLAAAWVFAFVNRLPAQQPDCAAGGFRYVEWPERGPNADKGRPLPALRGAEYGVDINSRIHISADTACILAYLDQTSGTTAGAASDALRTRIDTLSAIVSAIPKATEELQHTFEAYARRETDPRGFENQLGVSSTMIQTIVRGLRSAIQARFEGAGVSGGEAAVKSREEIAPIYAARGMVAPYDWDAMRQLIDREIRLARDDLDRLYRSTAYQLEVRAHLLSGKGQYPVALAGYNDESQCAETRIEPFEFGVSPAQAALYQQAESLEHRIGEARGLGDVLIRSVSADVDGIRPTLESLWTRAGQAAAPVSAAGKAVLRWTQRDTLRVWITSVGEALRQDSKGMAVKATLDALATELDNASVDIAALQALASFKEELAGTSALTAIQTILGRFEQLRRVTRDGDAPFRALQPATWTHRVDLGKQLLEQVRDLPAGLRHRIRNDPKGPVRDIEALRVVLRQVSDSLEGVSQAALDFMAKMVGLPPAVVAKSLPEPAGLRRRALGAGLDTDIELARICAERKENDLVQVEYRFFVGDRPITGWTDRFRLRVFGWRSRVAAGLAFVVREHTDTWRPGASVSWIFTHSRWPRDANRGLGSTLGLTQIGFGLTAVNLHFESDEAIELGLGPSLSFLGDRIIAGGGWNLQAHGDHLYVLLSVRLLDLARMN